MARQRQRMSVGGQTWSGQEGDKKSSLSLCLSLALSLCLSLPVSVPTAYFSSFTIPDRPANQPSRPCCSVPLTHEQQQYNNRKGPPLQVLSPTSLGVDLVIIINNCSSSRDKPSAFQNSWLCLWDGVARTDKLGVYLKVFYFGQWSAHHMERADGCD